MPEKTIDDVISTLTTLEKTYLSSMIQIALVNIDRLSRRKSILMDFLSNRSTKVTSIINTNIDKYKASNLEMNYSSFGTVVSSHMGVSPDFDNDMRIINYILSPIVTNLDVNNREYWQLSNSIDYLDLKINNMQSVKSNLKAFQQKLPPPPGGEGGGE